MQNLIYVYWFYMKTFYLHNNIVNAIRLYSLYTSETLILLYEGIK